MPNRTSQTKILPLMSEEAHFSGGGGSPFASVFDRNSNWHGGGQETCEILVLYLTYLVDLFSFLWDLPINQYYILKIIVSCRFFAFFYIELQQIAISKTQIISYNVYQFSSS
jgi:hypothetical protein